MTSSHGQRSSDRGTHLPFPVRGRVAVPLLHIAAERITLRLFAFWCGSGTHFSHRQQKTVNLGNRSARKRVVAQGSLSSLAAFPMRRGFCGAAHENSDYLVCGAARSRTAGNAAGPECGPCATL